jgi:hypothetical protein
MQVRSVNKQQVAKAHLSCLAQSCRTCELQTESALCCMPRRQQSLYQCFTPRTDKHTSIAFCVFVYVSKLRCRTHPQEALVQFCRSTEASRSYTAFKVVTFAPACTYPYITRQHTQLLFLPLVMQCNFRPYLQATTHACVQLQAVARSCKTSRTSLVHTRTKKSGQQADSCKVQC